jgi:fructokinase
MRLLGGIEAGGTKFICAVASEPAAAPVSTLRIDVTSPSETLGTAVRFFEKHVVEAIGIACFGPLDLSEGSPRYGSITATPKPGWGNTDVITPFSRSFDVPVGFDTDVNASALAEARYGAAQGTSQSVYVTVGTGIGGGMVMGGKAVHGLVHPEMGHIAVPRHPDDAYGGHCSFHRDCLEGMASGPAIEDRWGRPASTLPKDHQAWVFEAYYLARAISAMVYMTSPERIALGGSVMQYQPQLFPLIRENVRRMLNGYVQSEAILSRIDEFVAPPGLGDRAGIVGALELARLALDIRD